MRVFRVDTGQTGPQVPPSAAPMGPLRELSACSGRTTCTHKSGRLDGGPTKEIRMDTNWMARGNCATQHPDTFFPSDGVGVEVAKRICEGCPVQERCLEYALRNRIDHGVWGGCSERQRRRILRARKLAAAA